jgi:hypothetical protein
MRSIICFWKSINVHLFFLKAPFEGQKLTRLVDEVWNLLGHSTTLRSHHETEDLVFIKERR